MKLSEKRSSELYSAIREPIMDLGISVKSSSETSSEYLDEKLFTIEQQIWRKVKKSMDLKD